MAAGKKQVPLEHCPGIQAFTAGEVTCEELRPDKVEYFALIRAQGVDAAASQVVIVAQEAPLALVDRREQSIPIDFPDRRVNAAGA